MFLDAPDPVVQAVADYAGRGRSQAGRVLDEFISASSRASVRNATPRTSDLSRGPLLPSGADTRRAQRAPLPGRHSGEHRLGARCPADGGGSPSAWASMTTRPGRSASTRRWTTPRCRASSWSSSSSTRCCTSSSPSSNGPGRRVHHPPGVPRPRACLPALRGGHRLGAREPSRPPPALDTMRRAKIVCTLGPASLKPEVLEELLNAGMDVARLNFSHGTHAQHAQTLDQLRAASLKVRKAVGILGDLQGPKSAPAAGEGQGRAGRRQRVLHHHRRDGARARTRSSPPPTRSSPRT